MPLPMLCFAQVESYETTQPLLACKHQDGDYVYTHVLKMKSYIDKLQRVGVVFLKEQAKYLVLLSLPKLYDQFIKNLHMTNLDVTLTDLTYMLITAEAEMIESTTKAENA
mgnify:CR=1 FL=1